MSTPQEYISDADLELVSAYLDDEVTATERAALEARLPREPALRAMLDDLRATTQALRALPRLAPPRSLAPDPALLRPRWAGAFTWLRLGAALAAVLLVLTLTLDLAGNRGAMTASAPAPQMSAQSETSGGAMPAAEPPAAVADQSADAPTTAAAEAARDANVNTAAAATTAKTNDAPAVGGVAPQSADGVTGSTDQSTPVAGAVLSADAPPPTAAAMALQQADQSNAADTLSDTASLSTALQLSAQIESTAQGQQSFALPTPATDAIAASGSSSPGTAALEPQPASREVASTPARPLRLLEITLAVLALGLGLAALWAARQRRRR